MKNSEDIRPRTIMFIIISLSLTLASLDSLFAQTNFEYMQTNSKYTSRFRPNLYYNLPLGTKGYSFIELYRDAKNYFGETFWTWNGMKGKSILGAEVHAYYSDFFTDYIGIGPIITIPMKDTAAVFTLSVIPSFINIKGKYEGHYFLGEFVFFKLFKIPHLGTWRINSFGIINLGAKEGPVWEYGEIYLEKPVGKNLYFGAGANLFCNAKWYPDPDWGLKVGYSF